MPNYRRAFIPGGTWFFTVNLLQRHGNNLLISMAAALARALAAQAAAVVQTTAFRRRALQVAVQSAAKRFRRGFIPRQLNLPALAGKSLSREISLLRDTVRQVRNRYPFHIDAWVVLPEHLHCYVARGIYLPDWCGDIDISVGGGE